MKFKSLILSAVLMGLPFSAFAWNSTGHMLVSQIAYDNLTPAAKAQVDSLAIQMKSESFYNESYRTMVMYEDYLDIAHWPDDLKHQGYMFSSGWHYDNITFAKGCRKGNCGKPVPDPQDNVEWAIGNGVALLAQVPSETYGYSDVNQNVRARTLSYLVHFVGDAHQPLHCAQRATPAFPYPDADVGGNAIALVPIKKYAGLEFQYDIHDLHGFWDSAGILYPEKFGAQPSTMDKTQILNMARAIEDEYPKEFFGGRANVPPITKDERLSTWGSDWAKQWCQEGFDIAKKSAYPKKGGVYNTNAIKLSKPFMKKVSQISERRIALAGYRLASLLNMLFDPKSDAAAQLSQQQRIVKPAIPD